MRSISPDFPLKSRYVEVLGSRMHYVDEGEGSPILFLHDALSSSYLWRNVLPTVSQDARCIAIDLIGFGRSDTPGVKFTIDDQLRHLRAFVDSLGLTDIVIVGQGWGSVLGSVYAYEHKDTVRGVVMIEPWLGTQGQSPISHAPSGRTQGVLQRLCLRGVRPKRYSLLLKRLINHASLRKLSDAEISAYIEPLDDESRWNALCQSLRDSPGGSTSRKVTERIVASTDWLKAAQMPKLFFYTSPAASFTQQQAGTFLVHGKMVWPCYLGRGSYNHVEDYPFVIADEISWWLGKLT